MRTIVKLRPIGPISASLLSAIALVLTGALLAHAATFAVNSTVDVGDATPGDGVCETTSAGAECTLRAAIEETKALPGPDVVDVPAGVYALLADLLVVDGELTIIGAGAGQTIIEGDVGISVGIAIVALSRVTVRNAAIYNSGGTLTLTDSVVSGSGIRNEATLTVERSIIRGSATRSGIESLGALVVIDSTIADNDGVFGGGVFARSGTATLSNTTISGNTAVLGGGGISAGFLFNGLGCSWADVLLNNVTITNNIAGGGGGVAVFGCADPYYSTLRMRNTVIAGNSDQRWEAPDCGSISVISDGYNLIGDATGCLIVGDATGNLIGVSAQLGPLQDNDGPTPTHAPLVGSPLIDAGNPAAPGSGAPACEAADQRGVSRPEGVRCDIGAVEADGPPTTTTTVTTSSTSTTIPPPFCALAPRDDCMAALSGKSTLLLKQGSSDAKDVVSWKWRSSGVVAKADFGSPTVATDVAICIYDTSALRASATARAGGVCAGKSCWKETNSGFRYADRDLMPDGLATVRLKAGSTGAGRIAIKGRGANLALPVLAFTPPMSVQLQRRDGVACWSTTFSAFDTNTSEVLKAGRR